MPPPRPVAGLRVLRLCSVFEPPDAALHGAGVRFDPIGGMQSHTAQLTRALSARGVRQLVLAARPPGAPSRACAGGAVVRRFGLPVPWMRQGWSAPACGAALRHARAADLVHAHAGEDIAVLPIGLAAARAAGVPLVVTLHTSVRHTFITEGVGGRALKWLGGAAERAAVPSADAVIALTPRLGRLLAQDGIRPERIHVIPSGVTPVAYTGTPPDPFPWLPRPRVLFVGRLHRQKGVRTLLEGAARLRTPGVQVLVVGDGPERRAAETAARRMGIGDRVHFAGFRPHREIPAILRHADVFVMPSVYEELGSALLEAMQAGLPIVASHTGGIPDAVGPAAVLVPPGDAPLLAAAVDRLLADHEGAAELGARARRRAARYDWEALAGDVLAAYAAALGLPPQPADEAERAAALRVAA